MYRRKDPRKSTEQPWKVTRKGIYDGPGLDRNWAQDDIRDMREEVYDRPDLVKIWVNGHVATSSKRATERRH